MIDKDGEAVDPCRPRSVFSRRYDSLGSTRFEDYVELILKGARDYAEGLGETRPHLVLFLHGGLWSPASSIERVKELQPQMVADDVYPVFLSWDSSLVDSYLDHLLFIRRGNDFGALGLVVFPFYLAADLGRAILHVPITTLEGLWRWGEAVPDRLGFLAPDFVQRDQRSARRAEMLLVDAYQDSHCGSSVGVPPSSRPAIEIHAGKNRHGWPGDVWATVYYALRLPARIVCSPLLESLGKGAWNIMQRRIDSAVEPEADALAGHGLPMRTDPPGLPRFLQRLAAFLAGEAQRGRPWRVTLIGHSMGCMLANGILALDANRPGSIPELDDIVFLAPACSKKQFETTTLPFLARHERTRFFQLSLELRAELHEANYGLLLPPGSLLLWIDDYFAAPNSEQDHTLGRYINVLLAAHRIRAELRDRVTLTSFDWGQGQALCGPQVHGDFTEHRFWMETFWRGIPSPIR